MKTLWNLLVLLIVINVMSCKTQGEAYKEDWQSLAKHNEAPEWFKDAKFGIYFHWGVYSVPAFGDEWYPRWMHFPGHPYNKRHIEKYGELNEFGYHNFVPMFTAENFNAEEWVELFKNAGARFAGPVAEHHDGFSMWDSDITPWNAMDKGPHKDIMGEIKNALAKRDMKLITTFHHARNLQRYRGDEDRQCRKYLDNKDLGGAFERSHYPLFENTAPNNDAYDELNKLYGNIPEQQWEKEIWFGKLKEVVTKYEPDIVWFDSWLDRISEEKRKEFCAYYLNWAAEKNKEVVIVRKQDDLPLEVSVDDLEKSRKNRLEEKAWMTDETLSYGSWCYTEDLKIKPATDVLHVLIDIVSKNGVLLLNISPKADGTIPQEQREVLLAIGTWLKKYGEAIYATRPWYIFGEGPTIEPEGHFDNHQLFSNLQYNSEDIRFTTKGNTIYATTLGIPDNNKDFIIKTFAELKTGKNAQIKNVSLLGSEEIINWEQTDKGLEIKSGFPLINEMALVFKIELKQK